jgi:hypothetical protein
MEEIARYYHHIRSNRDDTIHRLLKREIDINLTLIETRLRQSIIPPIPEMNIGEMAHT